ncbi:hypothetical protein NA57DRAFT_63999 [Rhizodiscina lignyota]|uniref:CsbD-like domain-containing protein n=1 Tax=Rhizodiscina lignyota TaxID=1504668 RepID=A0A9P4MA34_9PEZI|nr:hypothetical protein NA57DRAFT_63999 [Rhizodiscina lignyota]
MSDKTQPSAIQSTIDSITATGQSILGAVTGNSADKAQAQDRKDKAQLEDDANHAGASLGGVSVSSSGVAANDPNRTEGSWNQTIGSGKEMLGNLVGAEGLKREGIEQNKQGKGQEAQGQLSDLGGGVKDRVSGTVGSAVAGLTNNPEAERASREQHDKGKTLQRGVESELQDQADADRK